MRSRVIKLLIVGLLATSWAQFGWADTPPLVTVMGSQPDTTASFSGVSSPGAFITVFDGGTVVGTTSAAGDGTFTKVLTDQTATSHTFGFQAVDVDSLSTPVYSFVVSLQSHADTAVSNILLPTTIAIVPGVKPGLRGHAAPGSQITIFVHPEEIDETETAAADGSWSHDFASPISIGSHTANATVTDAHGLTSDVSETVPLDVTCLAADFDCSGRVDIVDFSVLMYYYGTGDPTADLNADGIVDLTDFSILMFYYNG